MRIAWAGLFVMMSAAVLAGDDAGTTQLKVVLVGDSTVNDEGGWAPGFRASFGPRVAVINMAQRRAILGALLTRHPRKAREGFERATLGFWKEHQRVDATGKGRR